MKLVFFFFFLLALSGVSYAINQLDVDLDTLKVPSDLLSKDAIESTINYSAKDSIVFDDNKQLINLFGNAEIDYAKINLSAERIALDINKNNVIARGVFSDSTKKYFGEPVFKDADKKFKSHHMVYNFKTKKGLVKDVITNEGEGYIHGSLVKTQKNKIYIKDSKYTTCNLKNPHFYIQSSKLKVIPNDKIVSGPAVLHIEGTPTPLMAPFGFFPSAKKSHSGIIIPEPGSNSDYGLFLINGGYYLHLNRNIDFRNTFDFYSRGSWATKINSNYKKRYKYNGALSFSYSNFVNGKPEFPSYSKNQDFYFTWKHTQDPKSLPGFRFSADVNFGTSTNFRNNFNNSSSDFLTNNFNSSIYAYKKFIGTPLSLTALASHSQNSQTRAVTIRVPDITFNVSQIYPFQRKGVNNGKWYEKINFSYTSNLKTELITSDTLIGKSNLSSLLSQSRYGVNHLIPVSATFKILKYFALRTTLNYQGAWYFNSIKKKTVLSELKTDTLPGFNWLHKVSTGANLTTNLYGMYQFDKKRIKAIRHVITPSVGFVYTPENNFGNALYINTSGKSVSYSRFENGLYGNFSNKASGNVNFNINNVLIAKRIKKGKKEIDKTLFEKVNLIDNFSLSSSYNVFADSNHWSSIIVNTKFKVVKNLNAVFLTNLNLYSVDDAGVIKKDFEWQKNKRLFRLQNANMSLTYSLKPKAKKKKVLKKDFGLDRDYQYIKANPNKYVDFNIPWEANFSYNLFLTQKTPSKSVITQTVNVNGNVNLTNKWKIGVSTGYDFVNKSISYTTVDVYRNLHCWQIQFNWIPFGVRESFLFTIRANASILQDLKLVRKNLPSIF